MSFYRANDKLVRQAIEIDVLDELPVVNLQLLKHNYRSNASARSTLCYVATELGRE